MNIKDLSLLGLLISSAEAADYNAFATGYDSSTESSNTVYAFDATDLSTPANPIIINDIGAPDGVAFSPDGSTVYVTSYGGGDIYIFPVAGPYLPNALNTGINAPIGVAISSDGLTGFATTSSNNIYSFPTSGGSSTMLTSTGASIAEPLMIVINGSTAFVGDYSSTNVYSFPVNDTVYDASLVQTLPGSSGVNGLAISNDGYLYMALTSGPVYRVPLSDPTTMDVVQVSVAPEPGYADGVAVSTDNSTVFVALVNDGIFSFPTNMGFPQTPQLVTGIDIAGAVDLAILLSAPPLISTTGLTGNNLAFANYLNQNSPSSLVDLFTSLEANALAAALQSAAPTRNAFSPFVANNSLFSVNQQVVDHLQRERFLRRGKTAPLIAFNDTLFADAKETVRPAPQTGACNLSGETSVWVDAIGAYAHEKAQRQTPSFSASTGGFLAAADHSRCGKAFLGGGLAYLYDSIHQGQGQGRASINQALAVLYAEVLRPRFYLDLALWGGYYHVDQKRHISFPGVDETAKSSPHGWQLLPHLEMGGDFRWTGLTLEPFAMLDWANNWAARFTEHGAPGFNASQPSHYSSMLRSEAGLRFYEQILFPWGSLTLLEKGSYVNKALFQTGSVTAFLIGSAGSFTVETLTQTQNIGLGQFEMIFDPTSDRLPRFTLSYQGEFSVPYQSHQVAFIIEKQY